MTNMILVMHLVLLSIEIIHWCVFAQLEPITIAFEILDNFSFIDILSSSLDRNIIVVAMNI